MTKVKSILENVIEIVKSTLKRVYFLYDGAFGNNVAIQTTAKVGMHLI